MRARDRGGIPVDRSGGGAGGSALPYRTYRVEVLGCKVNQYEAWQIERMLEERGLHAAAEGEEADVSVVHTCAVTSAALRKTGQMLRRASARTRPNGRVLATGCAGRLIPPAGGGLADIVVPAGPLWMEQMIAELDALAARRSAGRSARDRRAPRRFTGHTRAFLKIQDGCDLGCSYCIVPSLRGPPRDKPLADIEVEARALVAAGHCEIVVTGVSVGLWGRAAGGGGLAAVLRRLATVEGLERIRMSSLHPAELTPELLSAWSSSPKVLPHAHLPLQSGSDAVLARMNRGYTGAEFLAAVERARRALDRPAFTTDLIVGFPGETEEDFDRTLAACREAGFSRLHIFPFSARPGTPAAGMGGTVPPAIAQVRVRRLKTLGVEMAEAYYRSFAGTRAQALCETWDPAIGEWEAYTERYIPVRFTGEPSWGGRIREVVLDAVSGAHVRARAILPSAVASQA